MNNMKIEPFLLKYSGYWEASRASHEGQINVKQQLLKYHNASLLGRLWLGKKTSSSGER